MKKFWNLMLVAFIALGAAACEEGFVNPFDKEKNPSKGEGFSFTAEIEQTRADVVADGAGWKTVWTGDDKLSVVADGKTYYFTNSAEALNRFTSTDEGASAIATAKSVVISNYHEKAKGVDSDAGKKGLSLYKKYDSFPSNGKVTLGIQSAFFRYSAAYEVELEASDLIFSGINDSKSTTGVAKLPAGNDVWVPFMVGNLQSISLVAKIGNEVVMSAETLEVAAGKIYNLGELTATEQPVEPSAQHKVYVRKYKSDWSALYLYSWDAEGAYTGDWPGTPSDVVETVNGYDYYVWTMPVEANDKDLYIIVNKGEGGEGNQTADFNLGTFNKDYYVLLNGLELSIIDDANNPDPVVTWALAGSFNEWGDAIMATTDTPNLFVVKGVELTTGDEVKVKDSTTWDVSFGGGITNLEPNKWMTMYAPGENIAIAKSGTYDVYFQYATEPKLYLVEANGDYTAATEQSTKGTLVPDEPENPGEGETPGEGENPGGEFVSVASEWAVFGDFNSDNLWVETQMYTTPDANVFVVEGLTIPKDYFAVLIKKWGDADWTIKYGAGISNFIPGNYMKVYAGGADIVVTTAGTYDFYFDLANGYLYVVAEGADYKAVSEQTTDGPKDPNATYRTIYFKPDTAYWDQAGAWFEAWVWGSTTPDAWYKFEAVSGHEGYYSVDVPKDCTGMKILRRAPEHKQGSWDDTQKWNNTNDVAIPADKDLLTITGWNGDDWAWSNYTL